MAGFVFNEYNYCYSLLGEAEMNPYEYAKICGWQRLSMMTI